MSDPRSGLLDGKRGVIFGALNDASIAWAIAEAVHREGGRFVLTNAPVARRLGSVGELAEKTGSSVVWADATDDEALRALFTQAAEELGGVDFIVHSIGMGLNVRKKRDYPELNYDWYHKTLDISAVSLHRTVTAALDTEALQDGASIVALTFVGSERIFSAYSEMGDAKALLESIVRSYGYRLGARGIRINAISQSPTPTTAGSGVPGLDAMLDFSERMSPLGNADAASCADFTVAMLSDLTRMVTMQTLYNDGGFSRMGISDAVMTAFQEARSE